MLGDQLIMELTMEQGVGRETQVQPPLNVWVQYFQIDLDNPPELTLINQLDSSNGVEIRPVVEHDHNWTVEIAGADVPKPAIIRFQRTNDSYNYWVYESGDVAYDHCEWLLAMAPNPYWTRGRRWMIL
jgi:hypothetical protein